MNSLGFSKFLKKLINEVSRHEQVCLFTTKGLEKDGPNFVVREKIAKGLMKSDYKQTPIINNLQEVYDNIQNYSPGKLLMTRSPRGLYIYGSVGAGKTMLMDIFYHCVKTRAKRRSHFNNFMADVHSRIHRLKKKRRTSFSWGDKPSSSDPISPVAKELVKEAWLLCFDEFQVTDIADAMILKRLFTEMFDNGMVMVATSNRAPDDLYKNGLQRVNFLPFIPVLKKHCKVVDISGKDYRTATSDGIENHYLILGESGTKAIMEATFNELCNIEKKSPKPRTLHILGHKIIFKNTCGRILYTSFKELCDKPLGSADYIQIAKQFDTILIKNVPRLNMNTTNQARRFILLIDTLYDNRVRLQISAAVPPKKLFSAGDGSTFMNDDMKRIMMDDLNIEKGSDQKRFLPLIEQYPELPKCVQILIGTSIGNQNKITGQNDKR